MIPECFAGVKTCGVDCFSAHTYVLRIARHPENHHHPAFSAMLEGQQRNAVVKRQIWGRRGLYTGSGCGSGLFIHPLYGGGVKNNNQN